MRSTTQSDLATDTVYDLLSSTERRSVVAHLRTRERTTLDELVDAIVDACDCADDRRVRIRLVHNHLPRLDDADVVDYDRTGGVGRGDRFTDLQATAASIDLEPSGSPIPLLE